MILVIMLQVWLSEGVLPKKASQLNASTVDSFERVGCFRDKNQRALPKLLHTFLVDWRDMNNSFSSIIRACAVNVSKAGFRYFGIQNYKECWSGVNGSITYDKYGRHNNCFLSYGVGTPWSNFVYRFVEVNGSWSHWTPWQPCNPTCGGGTRSRVRTCTNPRPKWNGLDCDGSSFSNGSCNFHNCADNDKNVTHSEPFSMRSSLPLVALWLGISLVVLLCFSGILWITLKFFRKRRSNSELVDPWEVVFDDISLCKIIGEGAFGKVYSAELNKEVETGNEGKSSADKKNKGKPPKQNCRIVAVKMLRNGATEEQKEEFLEEMQLMKQIGYHRNVLNLLACCTKTAPMFLVVEFAKHGDLLNFLRKRRDQIKQAIENMDAVEVYHPQCYNLGLSTSEINLYDDFLSRKGFVHRDLAARNVLVCEGKLLKVADFGLSRYVYTEKVYHSTKNKKLPIKWMSPEAIHDQIFTTESDVWSYGVLLWEMATIGGTPYPTISNQRLLKALNSGHRMEKPQICSDDMYDLMRQCWKEKPSERPLFSSIREQLERMMLHQCSYLDLSDANYSHMPFSDTDSDKETMQKNTAF
ncbi:Fibroblast growth factor receptor 1-A [Stylophora pistillata]|uniref:Fibroblast growth factor receptor 1-A n=1 Tax=Stylophora pistillata TaxID=50429 RepID=A0A2B4RFB7_STYPI|nr:Fibroblast growth factor receptor 1-A [Stylophora pistillata]